MGYTVRWKPAIFTDITYHNVTTVLSEVLDKATQLAVHDWGFTIGNDYDMVSISRINDQMAFCKTNRAPYTKDVMKAVILMVEYGAAVTLEHDESDTALWLLALDELQEAWPLVSYGILKKYFTT